MKPMMTFGALRDWCSHLTDQEVGHAHDGARALVEQSRSRNGFAVGRSG